MVHSKLETSLKGHFLNLYHIALSDAEVDTTELEMLYKIGEEKGVTRDEIDNVVIRPDKIRFISPNSIYEKVECLYDFARIAWADGRIDENEERVLKMFCSKFGFEEENIPFIIEFLLDSARKGMTKEDIFNVVSENQ